MSLNNKDMNKNKHQRVDDETCFPIYWNLVVDKTQDKSETFLNSAEDKEREREK